MGIKCSLLGHNFTGTSVEEERKEQGSEVVITVKEVETCDRCGRTRIVSENKEVRSIESASAVEDTDPEPRSGPDATASEPAGPPTGESDPSPDIDPAEDDAELIEEAEPTQSESESTPDPQPETGTGDTAGESAPAQDPVTATGAGGAETGASESHDDDAVILENDDDGPEREPGEWPEEARREGPGEAVDAGDTVEWPEDDGDDDDEWEPSESLISQIDETEVRPAGSATITVPEGQFECAECGFQTDVEASSLRAGDFCPDCKTGTLEHRPEE